MARLCALGQLIAFALGATGCLYTDPINQPPTVKIVPLQESLHMNRDAQFRALVSDPDQAAERLEISWSMAVGACAGASVWSPPDASPNFAFAPPTKGPLCVRATVRDREGAVARDEVDVTVENQPPTVAIDVTAVEPRPQATLRPTDLRQVFRFGSPVRLTAEATKDPDGDEALVYRWRVTGPSGEVAPEPCDERAPSDPRLFCFTAKQSGPHRSELTAADADGAAATTVQDFAIDEDRPPCIGALSVLPAGGDERDAVIPVFAEPFVLDPIFFVRDVDDETHAYPSKLPTSTIFARSILEQKRTVTLAPSEEAHMSSRVVGLEDDRPGTRYRLRIEARDALRSSAEEVQRLAAACGDVAICEVPEGCKRWVTWTVELR